MKPDLWINRFRSFWTFEPMPLILIPQRIYIQFLSRLELFSVFHMVSFQEQVMHKGCAFKNSRTRSQNISHTQRSVTYQYYQDPRCPSMLGIRKLYYHFISLAARTGFQTLFHLYDSLRKHTQFQYASLHEPMTWSIYTLRDIYKFCDHSTTRSLRSNSTRAPIWSAIAC